ncbi:polysaccharide deacetylase family protein [Oscillatoria sp. FACHB-1406]|uniref:polysaccharide deacetylase family protein n=1 Tax=Oscillatoria sp. FACHB-1406 TaxID=2692846 RepID=UPI0016834819|nr:polysaccharide deacetylase family protein [Oscillatoria sp. FACHB-1406]MBD2579447.1 polysaccharide deacetylase family protein [Oscillatoria sp. FACHB-1406]
MQETQQDNLNKYQGKVIEKVTPKTSDKIIALTFDDGPDGKTTLQVLDILGRYQVKATFFLIGENVKKYPYVTRRIVELGHAIGNHTLTHAYKVMSPESAAQEIEKTADEIAQFTRNRPLLFRPPLGNMNNGLVEYARNHNYLTVLWSINSEDSVGYPGVNTIAANVINRAHSGGIVLLHDAPWYRWKTIATLPTIIERLKAQGYRFVTVPELLTLAKGTPN